MIDAVCDAPRRADRRRGLTMVELLITMSIIGILASMVLFAMSTAQESARVGRTQATIATLHGLVMEHYDSYRTRRLPIERLAGESPRDFAKRRVDTLREMMRREMPDRASDVTDALPSNYIGTALTPGTALMQAYQRRFSSSAPSPDYQNAECLYLFITFADPEARSLFSDSQIGDVDEDGFLEFLDGWGNPIDFIRWPAGFDSELQSGDPVNDHDPFDPLKTDNRAYRLVPLIYSAGPDEDYNIVASSGVGHNPSDPYDANDAGKLLGAVYDTNGGEIDNIHNHLIGAR